MMKRCTPILGIAIFILALALNFKIFSEEKKAVARDKEKTINAIISEDAPPACNWNIKTPARVMNEHASQTVIVETANNNEKDCATYLSLRAPGFDVDPPADEQKIALAPDSKGSISWIIVPRKMGEYNIALSDVINTKTFGINVTDMFGLNAFQAKIFSFLGTIFGPMFTIPWWWDRLRKKRKI